MKKEKNQLNEEILIKGLDLVTTKIKPWDPTKIPDYLTTDDIINRIKLHYSGYNIDSLKVNEELLQRGYEESIDPIDNSLKWKVVELIS